jgi:hypothetical protein
MRGFWLYWWTMAGSTPGMTGTDNGATPARSSSPPALLTSEACTYRWKVLPLGLNPSSRLSE